MRDSAAPSARRLRMPFLLVSHLTMAVQMPFAEAGDTYAALVIDFPRDRDHRGYSGLRRNRRRRGGRRQDPLLPVPGDLAGGVLHRPSSGVTPPEEFRVRRPLLT